MASVNSMPRSSLRRGVTSTVVPTATMLNVLMGALIGHSPSGLSSHGLADSGFLGLLPVSPSSGAPECNPGANGGRSWR